MGCFNHKGNFSNLPIVCGDRIVVLVGIKNFEGESSIDHFAPGESFAPISLPIHGTYNDYGGICDVDMTPAVKYLEELFGMSVEDVVDVAERVQAGCSNQVEENLKAIMNIISSFNKEYSGIKEGKYSFSYVMEHEDIFNEMTKIGNSSIADQYHWRIPHSYIEELGYRKNLIGTENGYEIIEWTHDTLPKLKEKCYVWLENDFGNYSNVVNTLKDFYNLIGEPLPDKYNESFLKLSFLECCSAFEKISGGIDWFTEHEILDEIEKKYYSFIKTLGSRNGLYNCGCSEMYAAIFQNNSGLKPEYADEFVQLASLIIFMKKTCMTWGCTNYVNQEPGYDALKSFIEQVYKTFNEKYTEYVESRLE